MRKTLASITSTGASPWKFLLLAATLLFSYAIPAHADDHEEAAPAEVEEAADTSDADAPDYASMTVAELKDELKAKGLPVSGKKAELVERLQSA